jgi:hypothetical protein
MNGASNRSYPFSYSISAADTWEQKTITVAGDTTGTWLTTNGIGLQVTWSLAAGTNDAGTADAWVGATKRGVTGQVQVVSTLNATWYITGVQLEVGSVATPFERRPYGTELQLCYRYYYKIKPGGFAKPFEGAGVCSSTSVARIGIPYPVTMRVAPSALEQTGTAGDYAILQDAWKVCTSVPTHQATSTTSTTINATASSLLTVGYAAILRDESGNAFLAWSAEL